MMTLESIGVVAAIVASSISALFGSGLAKKYVKQREEMAVQTYKMEIAERDLKELRESVAEMTRDNAVMASKVQNIEKHLEKLDLIPDIAAKLSATIEAMRSLQEVVNQIAARRGE